MSSFLSAKIFLIVLMTTALAPSVCYAAERHGLSMVGQPAEKENFTHFAYANPDAPKGGTLRQSVTGSFDTVNPFGLKGTAAQSLNLVYDRLMMRSWDEPFTLYPLIAESVDVPEDRSSITFTLNPKAVFRDGSPILAKDVLFSFNILKENGRPNMRNTYKLVNKAEILDKRKIRFTLSDKRTAETVLILAMMPVLSEEWWSKQDVTKTLLKPPVSTGPYRITKIDVGRQIVLERNPDYWAKDLPVAKGLYNFDKIIFDYFKTPTTAFESFKAGDTDIYIDTNPGHWANAYDFPALRDGQVRKEEIRHGRVEKMWGFIFNTRRPPFDDLAVRKALSLVVDYDWINRNIFYGQYRTLDSYFPNSSLAATGKPSDGERALLAPYKNILPPEVFGDALRPPVTGTQSAVRANRIKASRLLDSAGWVIRNGQRIQEKTGKPLSFEMIIGTPEEEKLALSFKRSLAQLGIAVTLRTLDAAAFQLRLIRYDYDMMIYNWQNTLSPGSEQAVYWGCAAAKEEGRFNYAGICNDAVESLIRAVPNARSQQEMTDAVRALDRVMTAGHYAVPLFYTGRDFIASRSTLGHPDRPSLYGNIMETWWKKPKSAPSPGPVNRD